MKKPVICVKKPVFLCEEARHLCEEVCHLCEETSHLCGRQAGMFAGVISVFLLSLIIVICLLYGLISSEWELFFG